MTAHHPRPALSSQRRDFGPLTARVLTLVLVSHVCGALGACQSSQKPGEISADVSIPKPGPQPRVTAPEMEIRKLSNGVEVWHVASHDVPLVSINLLVRCGSVNDPPGKAGLASITADMLSEGAGERDALELADEIDYLGASFNVSASREHSAMALQVLIRNVEPALDILADVLLRPRLAAADWERVKGLQLNALLQGKDNPGLVARNVSYRILFGAGHPYAHPVEGYVDSVGSLDLQDVTRFFAEQWRPEGAVVISCGDLDVDRMQKLLETRLGAWQALAEPRAASSPPDFPSPPAAPPRNVYAVNKPGAAQTVVRIAGPGIARDDPDYVPLSIANNIFGGSFTSRLTQNLREEHGYTYGAGSDFTRLRGQGTFVAGSTVRTDVTGESLTEFAREYRRLAEEGITAAELDKARATLSNGVVENLQTVAGTASLFLSPASAGLPPTEIAEYLDRVAAADRDRVLEAIRRTIRWRAALVFLVGDLEAIRTELEAVPDTVGLGELVVVDEEGRPVGSSGE